MANEVSIKITADPKDAEAGFKKVKSGFQSVKDSIVKNRKAIGVGILAMGAGIEALAQKQAGLTESSRKLANATQFSEGEIRTMASSLSNATFPLDEVLGLMELGAQQGLESAEALKAYAGFWDTVGDATGLSSEALAKAGAALAAVGVEVGNESELLGAFGLISQESTQSVKDFLDGISRMAPEMSAMGISVDEAAVIMTAMERELGLTARTARTEFKEALEQSETGLAGVLEQLGLNEAQIATYTAKLGESSEVIQANADAHASTKTVMDKMKSSLKDLAFANGAMIEKASMIAPLFLAAGPIMAGFSGIMGILTPAVSAAKLAFIGLNLSMGPITLIIIGIGVAIVAAIVIWKNWDKIILALKKTLEVLKATFKTVFDFIKEIVSKVFAKITDVFNSKLMWLLPHGALIKAILFLHQNWETIFNSIKDIFSKVTGAVMTTALSFKTRIVNVFSGIKDGIVGAFTSVKDRVMSIWSGLLDFLRGKAIMPVIKGILNSMVDGLNVWIRRINDIVDKLPGRFGIPKIDDIPRLAAGGMITQSGSAIVGERGPELVSLPRGASVAPLKGGGAGMTINLTINGDVNGFDDFQAKVTAVVRDAVLGGGFSGVLARA
jgi:flagellin-like hook-associated protein FlgL